MNADRVPASASRFDGLADAYACHRPSYPAEAIATILADVVAPPDVVDLGAGTGIGTRLLADAGATVIGIEPSDDMRAVAAGSGLDVRAGVAAATGLPDACADVVTAFQAFHWFATDDALGEARRVLRRRGRIALVWNERDPSDEFAMRLRSLELRNGEREMYTNYDSTDEGTLALLERNGFHNARKRVFPNEKRFDEAGIVGRLHSLSFAPRQGEALDAFVAETLALFARHRDADGFVALRMRTEVFLGDLVR